MNIDLDSSQRAFVDAPPIDIRLLAPAGCGKTMSLLLRAAHLIRMAAPHRPRLLFVTFTVAARDELATRVAEDEAFSDLRDAIEITTLNSWGYRRLRTIGFNPRLVTNRDGFHFAALNQLQPIWTNFDRVRDAIKENRYDAPRRLFTVIDGFKSLGFDHTRHLRLDDFAARVAELRGEGLRPRLDAFYEDLAQLGVLGTALDGEGRDAPVAGAREVYEHFFVFWREATKHLMESETFTFEDQKYVAYLDERRKLEEGRMLTGAARYDHVLVDEFQDINPLDLALVKAISERSRAKVTVAGDDDQSVFEWRGASPEYILDPGRFFGREFVTFLLSVNYRSPKNIVRLSQRLIAHNVRRVDKQIRAARTDDAEILCTKAGGLTASMNHVHDEIRHAISEGTSPAKIAVIGRTRSQLIPYQIFFAANDVPFCAAEDLQLFLSNAFETLLNLLVAKSRAADRQPKTQLGKDIVDLCGLVKSRPLAKDAALGIRQHISASTASTLLAAVDALAEYRGPLKGSNPEGRVSRAMAEAIGAFLSARSVSQALLELSSRFGGLQRDFGKAEEDVFYVDPPFLHLAEYAVRYFDDYLQFVDDLECAKNQLAHVAPFLDDTNPTGRADLWKRPVHLMTATRAKGKEFDTVILLGVNDSIWPSKWATTPAEFEAERRLFYVAFTRARQRVVALIDRHYGGRPVYPSPYLRELGLES